MVRDAGRCGASPAPTVQLPIGSKICRRSTSTRHAGKVCSQPFSAAMLAVLALLCMGSALVHTFLAMLVFLPSFPLMPAKCDWFLLTMPAFRPSLPCLPSWQGARSCPAVDSCGLHGLGLQALDRLSWIAGLLCLSDQKSRSTRGAERGFPCDLFSFRSLLQTPV